MKNVDIIQFGIYRSGSTLIYQYLKYLFPDKKVLKVHQFVNGNVPTVITVRDYKDCIVSLWRAEKGIKIGKDYMTKEDIDLYSQKFCIFPLIIEKYEFAKDKVLILNYENFFNNFDYLHDKIEKYFNIKISNEKRKILEKLCSIETNKKRQKRFDTFEKYGKHGIHGNHIHTGKSIWKDVVPKELHNYFIEKCKL